jgi:hypothetical protein
MVQPPRSYLGKAREVAFAGLSEELCRPERKKSHAYEDEQD